MPIYTVHEPPIKAGAAADPGRFVFVRDGFHFWAFLLGPVWIIWRGLWLAFVLYAVAVVAIGIALYALNIGGAAATAIMILLALLIGVEASTLRRWTLRRNGWRDAGAVVGDDSESAERRFFSAWMERAETNSVSASSAQPPAVQPAGAMRMPKTNTPDVVGLFPEPGGQR
jgi:hypothetical protein